MIVARITKTTLKRIKMVRTMTKMAKVPLDRTKKMMKLLLIQARRIKGKDSPKKLQPWHMAYRKAMKRKNKKKP